MNFGFTSRIISREADVDPIGNENVIRDGDCTLNQLLPLIASTG